MIVLVLNIILLCGGSLTAWAEADFPGVPWKQLSQPEQQLLQKFNQDWDQLPADRQERLRNGARQWSNMNPEERTEAHQRFQEWRQMSPDDQQRLRERFQRFRELPPEKRDAIRNARQWYRSLPQEKQHEMRQQWKNMSPEERQVYRRELRQRFGQGQGASPNQPRPNARPFQNHSPRHGR